MNTHPSQSHPRVPSVIVLLRRGLRVVPLAAAVLQIALAGCSLTRPSAAAILDSASISDMHDAKVALSGSFTAMFSGTEYALNITGGGRVVVKPSQTYHLNANVDVKGSQLTGTIVDDLIRADGKLYTKVQSDTPGLPVPPNMNTYMLSTAPSALSDILPTDTSRAWIIGEETVRGDKCWQIQEQVVTGVRLPPTDGVSTAMYSPSVDEGIRESDFYYVRVQLPILPGDEGSGNGTASGFFLPDRNTSTTNVGVILDFSDFNSGVTISAPPASQISGS